LHNGTNAHHLTDLSEKPGVYDNVLEHEDSPVYDSSPHVWHYSDPVDISPDEPYSCYPLPCDAVKDASMLSLSNHVHPSQDTSSLQFIGSVGVGGGQGNSDCIYGSCDDHDTFGIAGHGWYGPGNGEDMGDLWNPAVATHTGMQSKMALAAPVSCPSELGGEVKKSRPSPGHFVLMGHAMLFGALSASTSAKVLSGEESWTHCFKKSSTEAASAITPVGGFLLKEKVFGH